MTDRALDETAERALRDAAPRVLAALLRRSADFAAAEDAVQDAVLDALQAWRERGMPTNPGGWLFQVALRRLADRRDAERRRHAREQLAAAPPHAEPAAWTTDEPLVNDGDDTLRLLFLCCHPSLSPPSAIALLLRAVGGLTTREIAHAFLVPEATMGQRISRAKKTIAEAGAHFAMPDAADRERRLGAVLHVLYLMFNEGHTSSGGAQLLRVELASEAIRLARALHAAAPAHAETAGLLALLLLTDARRAARTGPDGELIALDEQDRSRWDRAMIAEGTALLDATIARGALGSYQIQAAIAALHDAAASVDATDWPQILALYDLLLRMTDNPMVAVNRAVAAAMVHGPAAGLAQLDALAADHRIAEHHRLDAVRAHLHERNGDRTAALRCYMAAAAATTSLPERQYLLARAARLQPS